MKAHYTAFVNKQQRDMYARKIEEMQHGFDYLRCDCEIMEKTFYKPPEIPAEEKRKVFSEMQRMREFLQREVNGDEL